MPRLLRIGKLAVCLSLALQAQNKEARPAFEVASIKPADSQEQAFIKWSGIRLTVAAYTPRMLIQWAFDVRDDRLLGKSRWLDSARYDIIAQPSVQPRMGELQLMMRSLLADRFGLIFHREQRTLPFFALTVDNGGPKVKLSEAPPGPANNAFNMTEPGRLRGTNVTAAMLANVLSNQIGRSVQDFTGLPGIFDFTLVWASDDVSQDDTATLASLPTALREQLGLKLESRKGPVDVIVVDQLASAPSAN